MHLFIYKIKSNLGGQMPTLCFPNSSCALGLVFVPLYLVAPFFFVKTYDRLQIKFPAPTCYISRWHFAALHEYIISKTNFLPQATILIFEIKREKKKSSRSGVFIQVFISVQI